VLILDLAANIGGLASTVIALFFGYRTATMPIDEGVSEADLHRQSVCGSYTVLAAVLAAVCFGMGLLAATA
jgi:hypothetical protein